MSGEESGKNVSRTKTESIAAAIGRPRLVLNRSSKKERMRFIY